jgi:hypothetical protein
LQGNGLQGNGLPGLSQPSQNGLSQPSQNGLPRLGMGPPLGMGSGPSSSGPGGTSGPGSIGQNGVQAHNAGQPGTGSQQPGMTPQSGRPQGPGQGLTQQGLPPAPGVPHQGMPGQLPAPGGVQYAPERSGPYGSPPHSAPFGGPASMPYPPYGGPSVPAPLPALSVGDAVQSAHAEGFGFGEAVARDAPALWLEAVLARKPRMPSDLEARLLQGSALPIDSLLHDEVRHALRRGFWDALERSRR